jgi:uroporphyrinogen decarboxylase
MTALTTQERFRRVLDHQQADRVPIWDFPWPGTLARWYREGLPPGIGFAEFFDLDQIARIEVDNSPRYREQVVEETEQYKIYTTKWGATLQEFKHADSTPGFLAYTVTTPEKWQEAKLRMTPSDDRIPWDYLQENYGRWRDQGSWIDAKLFFGFDSAHALTVGFETFLTAMIERPQWCADMFNHYLDVSIALQDRVWDAGYKFDSVTWTDDLGYKKGLFISLDMYRALLKPVQKRAVEWAHGKGAKVRCHTDGNINALVPDLIDIGIDMLHPLEAKAGMNALEIKQKYGQELTIHGALDAQLWTDVDAIEAEIQRLVPVLKQSGGYIFASDHSIPNSVSFENIKAIVALAKKYGSYES